MTYETRITRRQLLVSTAAAGGGLALGFWLSPLAAATAQDAAATTPEVNAWVVIQPDDTVIIRISRSEMGQGTLTGLAQLVAEELECDWSKVTTEYPTPGESARRNRPWGGFETYGSRGIRASQEYVRQGGAAARMMLIGAAAESWGVDPSECVAADSLIRHAASGRETSFGAVAEAASHQPVPEQVTLKSPQDWKIIGQPIKRLDTPDKVTGQQVYGIDLVLPGMLNAAITKCPVFGGKLQSFDAAAAEKMKGVKKVLAVGGDAVAVVAEKWWQAKSALAKVQIEWDTGEHGQVSSASIAALLAEGLEADGAYIGQQHGDVQASISSAGKTIEAVYAYPFQNHAPMEPMNATVRYTPERCEAWVPTQDGEDAFNVVVKSSGLQPEQCDVYKLHIGGGFGRRTAYQDYLAQAVEIARHFPGNPVKLVWSREEDMAQGRYHPIMQAKLVGALDADGQLTGLHMRLSGQSIMAGVFPQRLEAMGGKDPIVFQGIDQEGDYAIGYTIPNLLIDHAMRNTHVPPGFWRGVNINHNAIFLECFMDEMAIAAGQDPLDFRRRLMGNHPRHLAVLEAVADGIGWTEPPAAGIHRGLAQMKSFGSYVAAACELSVEDGKRVKIHRIVAATDCSYAVNPAQIERQVSGSFVYGLSALFMQECTVKDGRIEQRNFDSYPSMRIAQMPPVETIIIEGGGDSWGGVGEPTIAVAAPAVLNAIYRATGQRYRSVPLKNHGIELV